MQQGPAMGSTQPSPWALKTVQSSRGTIPGEVLSSRSSVVTRTGSRMSSLNATPRLFLDSVPRSSFHDEALCGEYLVTLEVRLPDGGPSRELTVEVGETVENIKYRMHTLGWLGSTEAHTSFRMTVDGHILLDPLSLSDFSEFTRNAHVKVQLERKPVGSVRVLPPLATKPRSMSVSESSTRAQRTDSQCSLIGGGSWRDRSTSAGPCGQPAAAAAAPAQLQQAQPQPMPPPGQSLSDGSRSVGPKLSELGSISQIIAVDGARTKKRPASQPQQQRPPSQGQSRGQEQSQLGQQGQQQPASAEQAPATAQSRQQHDAAARASSAGSDGSVVQKKVIRLGSTPKGFHAGQVFPEPPPPGDAQGSDEPPVVPRQFLSEQGQMKPKGSKASMDSPKSKTDSPHPSSAICPSPLHSRAPSEMEEQGARTQKQCCTIA